MTAHPAALVLADHQPVYVTAATAHTATVRCSCKATVQWCDFATHQTEALDAAGLLVTVDQAPTWMPGAGFGSCYCQIQPRHFRGPGCEMVMEL